MDLAFAKARVFEYVVKGVEALSEQIDAKLLKLGSRDTIVVIFSLGKSLTFDGSLMR
jgi:hypothetical protein